MSSIGAAGADEHAPRNKHRTRLAANTAHSSYIEELPLNETADIIARGSGVMGTNREYLEQLAGQLKSLEIEDPYVHQLAECVRNIGSA
jgi:cation transport regulator ChaC